MGILKAGTIIPGSSDPRTVEQNSTLQNLGDPSIDGRIPSRYRGSFLYPDGTLTRDETFLVKPPNRVSEINAIIAAGTDPSKPSGGYILILNEDGIPIQYVGIGPVTVTTPVVTPTPATPDTTPTATPKPTPIPIPVTPINALDYVRFTPSIDSLFTKKYVWKSLNYIDDTVIKIENISSKASVTIRFESLHGSILVPESFTLSPLQSKNVTIKYSNNMLERTVPFEGSFMSGFNIHVRGV